MERTVLVTGATGLLGRQVLLAFQRAQWIAVGTGFSRAQPPVIQKVDLEDANAVSTLLDEVKPQVVVHCAANRFPDKCDADPEGARKINVQATQSLAKATSSRDIVLIYISTDYVFPGKPGEAPYEADTPPQPTNLYGQTKLDGESEVLEVYRDSTLGVILRVPVLYGSAEDPKESAVNVLLNTVTKSQGQDAGVKMDDWALRYPTNTEDVGRVCEEVARAYTEDNPSARARLPRILQFSSEDRFTKYEMCELFAEIMGLPMKGIVANKEGNDPSATVQRPYDTHLSTKALRDIGIEVWTQDFKAWWRREVHAFRH